MSFYCLMSFYNDQTIVDYNGPESWQGPDLAYRLREEYEDETSIADRLHSLLQQPGRDQISTLLIGAWSGACEGQDSQPIIELLVEKSTELPNLRALFLGDITSEETELSWINQSDVSPVLQAYPGLEIFGVRGGSELSFSKVSHTALRKLVIETGGLNRGTIREIFLCDFPALEHLEIQLGESGYGFDGTVEDLQPILSGSLFPKLKYLGLMNSEIANDIAAVIVNSPIVERIETLDLSLGTLDTEGVRSLLGLASHPHLKCLNISHNYATQAAIDELIQTLPFEVIAEDSEGPDEEWRAVANSE